MKIYTVKDIDEEFPVDLFVTTDFNKAYDFLSRIQEAGDEIDTFQKFSITEGETTDVVLDDITWLVWVRDDEITNICINRWDDSSPAEDYTDPNQPLEQCYKITARTYKQMKQMLVDLRGK